MTVERVSSSGFTVVEVVVASTLFFAGIVGALNSATFAEQLRLDTVARQDATLIAEHVRSRILAASVLDLPCQLGGTEIATETDNSSGPFLGCFGTDMGAGNHTCAVDHPVNDTELNLVLGSVIGLPGADQVFGTVTPAIAGEPGFVQYRERTFRVAWNVHCFYYPPEPLSTMRQISVLVGWGQPENLVVEGRYVQLSVPYGGGF